LQQRLHGSTRPVISNKRSHCRDGPDEFVR
jgi:hypothetical protein